MNLYGNGKTRDYVGWLQMTVRLADAEVSGAAATGETTDTACT